MVDVRWVTERVAGLGHHPWTPRDHATHPPAVRTGGSHLYRAGDQPVIPGHLQGGDEAAGLFQLGDQLVLALVHIDLAE